MRQLARLAALGLLLVLAVSLAACSGGGAKRRINPPRASLQEIAVQDSGTWRTTVRLQNFSTVPTTFADVDARLEIGGQDAGPLRLQPALNVGPESADVAVVALMPTLEAKAAVAAALAANRSVRYRITGRIVTSEPKGSFQFEYESALNPVPGLAGVLR